MFGVQDLMHLPCYQESPRIWKNVILFQNDIFSTKFCNRMKRDKKLPVSSANHLRQYLSSLRLSKVMLLKVRSPLGELVNHACCRTGMWESGNEVVMESWIVELVNCVC